MLKRRRARQEEKRRFEQEEEERRRLEGKFSNILFSNITAIQLI
jgi:hypothetical protein